jgi:hypothetical protein
MAERRSLTGGIEPAAFVESNGNGLNRIHVEIDGPVGVGRSCPGKDPVKELASQATAPPSGRDPHSPDVILVPVGEHARHADQPTRGLFGDKGCRFDSGGSALGPIPPPFRWICPLSQESTAECERVVLQRSQSQVLEGGPIGCDDTTDLHLWRPNGYTSQASSDFRAPEDLRGRGWKIAGWGQMPPRVTGGYLYDQATQAREVEELLRISDEAGVYAAFVFTFVDPVAGFADDARQQQLVRSPDFDPDILRQSLVKA